VPLGDVGAADVEAAECLGEVEGPRAAL